MDTAELLFARRGFQGATTREIVEAAGQRNASALTYHFGTRENLLVEILARRGRTVDAARGALLAELAVPSRGEPVASRDEPVASQDLVRCLVNPYAAELHTEGGRAYLRVVAQLRGHFATWRVDSDEATTLNLATILDDLAARVPGPGEVRDSRLLAMMTLLTGVVAERAQAIDANRHLPLSHGDFCSELVVMCTAVLGA
ncbi:MAG: helix-turn-helix domain-containing protein [Microthrixaceae bacterium]